MILKSRSTLTGIFLLQRWAFRILSNDPDIDITYLSVILLYSLFYSAVR